MLTHKRLRERLHYDPNTGIFTWLVSPPRGRVPARDVAGCLEPGGGYRTIGVDGGQYRAHRLAWLFMTGEWPAHEIDHENLVRSDNRWENLRQATRSQNVQNTRVRKDNWIGQKGVGLRNRGWGAFWHVSVEVDGKRYSRACHGTLEEAATMRAELARKYHADFARAE